eukprot:UN03484
MKKKEITTMSAQEQMELALRLSMNNDDNIKQPEEDLADVLDQIEKSERESQTKQGALEHQGSLALIERLKMEDEIQRKKKEAEEKETLALIEKLEQEDDKNERRN